MERIRIGNDIAISWALFENNGATHLINAGGASVSLNCGGYTYLVPSFSVQGNVVSFIFPAEDQVKTGKYKIVLTERNESGLVSSYDVRDAFVLVPENEMLNVGYTQQKNVEITSVITHAAIANIKTISIVESEEEGGDNVVTFVLTDGSQFPMTVKNGSKGDKGDKGDQGIQGEKGDKGDTGARGPAGIENAEVSVDDTTGTPSVEASIEDGVLSLAFSGIKGEKGDKGDKGNTGSSVDFPYELVTDVETDDDEKGLAASQGVVLDNKISQLGQQVDDLDVQINGGSQDIVDYTVEVNTSGEDSGYPNLNDLSGFETGKTYKITIQANETAYIRINTRNSLGQTVQVIANDFAITSGNSYDFYWTKQATETRLFSFTSNGTTYKCVFTISHEIQTPGIVDEIADIQGAVEDIVTDVARLNEQLDGGTEVVTDYTKTVTISGESTGYPNLNDLSRYKNGKTYTIRIQANEDASIQIKTRDSNASTVQSIADGFLITNGQTYEFQWTKQSSEARLFSMTNNGTTYKCVFSILHDEHIEGISEKVERISTTIPKRGWSHISFDDVCYCLHDITVNANNYSSIFENEFFAVLKNLHETYGAVFSLFVFLEDATTGEYATGWTLANTTTKFRDEFAENSSWIKFGLHAPTKNITYQNRSSENTILDYQSFVTSILAITGTVDCIDRLPRLGAFEGTETNIVALRDCDAGIIGALTAYDTRDSYYLSSVISGLVYKNGVLVDANNHLAFFTSLSALEVSEPSTVYGARLVPATMGRFHNLEWMMHEYAIGGQDYGYSYDWDTMVSRLETACQYSVRDGYRWGYPQDSALSAGL